MHYSCTPLPNPLVNVVGKQLMLTYPLQPKYSAFASRPFLHKVSSIASGKNTHSLLVLKFPNIKKKSHTALKTKKKRKTKADFYHGNCLGCAGFLSTLSSKIQCCEPI